MTTTKRKCGMCGRPIHKNSIRRHENEHLTRLGLTYKNEAERAQRLKSMRQRLVTKPSLDAVLEERRATHGVFANHARLAQKLKLDMYLNNPDKWDALDPDMQEGLEMIQHKVARILNGNPAEPDHWMDIAGYAQLVGKRLADAKTGS